MRKITKEEVQEKLNKLESVNDEFEKLTYEYTTGDMDISAKMIDEKYADMKKAMRELRSIAKQVENKDEIDSMS